MNAAHLWVVVLVVWPVTWLVAGPYSASRHDPLNPHDPPVPAFIGPDGPGLNTPSNRPNPQFIAWATQVVEYAPAPGVSPGFDEPLAALGPVTGDQFDIVSLGDLDAAALQSGIPPGFITLGFPVDIMNGPGPDFAVFENGFGGFNELAYVEVSSDGMHYARFPSVSLTANSVAAFSAMDPTEVYNLAGKHTNNNGDSWGTPFDLGQLAGHSLVITGQLDLMRVRFVRVVDIPGTGQFLDGMGDPIYDPWLTMGSGGFDLEAVGVIHAREEVAIRERNGHPVLSWTAHAGRTYQVEVRTGAGPWLPLGTPLVGGGHDEEMTDPAAAAETRHYRLHITVSP